MVKVPCKITLTGDKDYARNFIGAAKSQMRILENQMSFQGLAQGTRRTKLDPRTVVESTVCFNLKEAKIYSEPFKGAEEIKEELLGIGRFFAKVRRGGLYGKISFYWLTFIKDRKGNIKINVNSAGSSKNILGRMSAIPYTTLRATHSLTKSFMVKNDDDKDERWIAAPHLLVKEGIKENENGEEEKTLTEVFNPLGYPYAQNNLTGRGPTGESSRYYPLPPLFNPFGYNLPTHPAPPNRFYCNTEARKMVWYSCYSVMDYTIPIAPVLVHCCFGIILTLTDNMISEKYYSPSGTEYQRIVDSVTDKELIKIFNCDSSEVDDEGFDPLWYYIKPDMNCNPLNPPVDPMCGADADVPYQMLLDVNSLDEDTLEVFVPWGERPIKFTIDLTVPSVGTGDNHTYEVVTETQHWYWAENGFEQEKFVNLEYNATESGVAKYSDNPVPAGSIECNGCAVLYSPIGSSPSAAARIAASGECTGGCDGLLGKYTETFRGTWEKSCYRSPGMGKTHKETIYDIFLPGKKVNMTSRDWEIATTQGKCREYAYCEAVWACTGNVVIDGVLLRKWELTCIRHESDNACIRYIVEELKQKLADSVNADWCSPNIVFVGSERDRTFVDAFEEMGRLTHDYSTVTGENIQYEGTTEYAQLSEDRCFAASYWGEGDSGITPCEYGLPISSFMPYRGVNLWGVPVDSEEFSSMSSISSYGTTDCFLPVFIDPHVNRKKTSNKNTFDEPLVLQYQVDGEGFFSSQSFNRTYYLDDRSSVDSEGLFVAARGAEVAGYELDEETLTPGNPIFNVARWSAVYKFPGESTFIEVINELLKALNCDVSELIELGLV